jgi:hypothetical protein
VMLRILADGYAAGQLTPARAAGHRQAAGGGGRRDARDAGDLAARAAARLTEPVRADLGRARADIAPGVPDPLMLAAMAGWTQLFGIVSFELFGQFNNVVEARAEFFDQQMELAADVIGL